MSGYLKQAWLIAKFDMGTALRTRRALAAVLLYTLVALATGAILVFIDMKLGRQFQTIRAATDLASHAGDKVPSLDEVLSFFLHGDKEMARHLLDLPLVVAGFFWVTLTFLPYLVALVSFDIVNSEVRNRSARFVLLRCPRTVLLAGKMLSHGTLFLAVTVISNVALFAYAWSELPGFPIARAGLLLFEYWLITIVFGFCYLSLAALVSSLIDSGGLSLVVLFIVLVAMGTLSMNNTIGFLSPSYFKLGLWSPRLMDVAQNLLAFAGFGCVFLGLAWVRLHRRDL
ncbi:MAG: ABC transporter permease subunit [Deltaproteobacteria bacterium]|nr:ABC transporter permease subunit [Deltaproteobacteria bacterium]